LWLNDEGVLLHAQEWVSGAGDKVTAYGLAKAVSEYLDTQRAKEAIQGALIYGPGENKIRVRTAQRWLNKLGLEYEEVIKGVYIDRHEKEETITYRETVFLPRWKELEHRMVILHEGGG
jgi:hypothetical protein